MPLRLALVVLLVQAVCLLLAIALTLRHTHAYDADDIDPTFRRQLHAALDAVPSSSTASSHTSSPSTPAVRLTRNLTGAGFHLTLTHAIPTTALSTLPCSPSALHLLYTIPPTFYLDLDAIATTHRLQPATSPRAYAHGPIDVELPAEQISQHDVVLSFPVQPPQHDGWRGDITIHLRYQRARQGGGYAHADLPLPRALWLQCSEADDWTPLRPDWAQGTGDVLHATVPVGDLRHADAVWWSVSLLSLGGLLVLALVMTRYPIPTQPEQSEHSD